MEINNEIMEIVSFEKRTFEEIAAKLDYFVQRMDDLCRQHGEKKAERWMDSHDSVTTAHSPLPRLATAPTTVWKTWNGSLWMWKRDGKRRNGKAKAFSS